MTHTITLFGFVALSVCCIGLAAYNRKLSRQVKRQARFDEDISEIISAGISYRQAVKESVSAEAKVEERDYPTPCFAVYREYQSRKIDVLIVPFNLADPDDREYKRIHAEEVAEKLNEKP